MIDTGCAYDYEDGVESSRTGMSVYMFQIYVGGGTKLLSDPVEHWFRGNSDLATPVTFRLDIPLSTLEEEDSLKQWLEIVIIADTSLPVGE
jgi:hypothetical protein